MEVVSDQHQAAGSHWIRPDTGANMLAGPDDMTAAAAPSATDMFFHSMDSNANHVNSYYGSQAARAMHSYRSPHSKSITNI